MWEFGTAAAAIVALLVPAAPGQTPTLPSPPEPAPGCIVQISGALDRCPRGDPSAPVLCIVPVTAAVPGPAASLEPTCPDPVPDPRAQILPITR